MAKKKEIEEVEETEAVVAQPEPLIIHCLANGSRRILLTPTITNDVAKTSVPGLDLFFEVELKMCWHSAGQTFPPTWLRHYGSPQAVLVAIKEAMDVQMAIQKGLFEYITQAQYDALLAESSRKDTLSAALAVATENPEDEDAKELIEVAKRLEAKRKTLIKRGAISSGDVV